MHDNDIGLCKTGKNDSLLISYKHDYKNSRPNRDIKLKSYFVSHEISNYLGSIMLLRTSVCYGLCRVS